MGDQVKHIVYFDGVCTTCNRFIRFLSKRDRKRIFYYAPLQGKTAQEQLSTVHPKQLKSIVYTSPNGTFNRSNAVFEILKDLGRGWQLLIVLKIFPRVIRDGVYNWIAKHRYAWFGQLEQCAIPTAEEKDRWLD